MDEVFGKNNFRNFIVRKKCNPKNSVKNVFGNMADFIMFYTKGDSYTWNRPMIPMDPRERLGIISPRRRLWTAFSGPYLSMLRDCARGPLEGLGGAVSHLLASIGHTHPTNWTKWTPMATFTGRLLEIRDARSIWTNNPACPCKDIWMDMADSAKGDYPTTKKSRRTQTNHRGIFQSGRFDSGLLCRIGNHISNSFDLGPSLDRNRQW